MHERARLDGKVALVMGAGSLAEGWGNGKACAVTYARWGAAVACVDFHLDRAEATAALITEEGGRAIALQADATQESDVLTVVAATTSQLGGLDIVHNNVGVGNATGLVHEVAPADWQREIDQNLTSAYLGIRCTVPHLMEQGSGVIINTSSLLAVRFLRRSVVSYTVAKAAVEALTRASAASYGPHGIRVNCVRIGFSETPLVMQGLVGQSEEEIEAAMSKSRRKVPLRHEHGDAFDVALASAFLASDDAKHITGVILNVDGGLEVAPI